MSSYPFRSGPAYARNQWYIAAWADEVGAVPLARTLLDQEIVLWRGAGGSVSAVSSRCPHRWAPMSQGRVVGDTLQCPYHGAAFGLDGRCTGLPSGDRPPPSLTLRHYPVIELGPCLWIWAGDAARCDPALLPDAASLGLGGGEAWRVDQAGPFPVAARPQLLIENLFDQSHVDVVHPATLNAGASHAESPYVEHIVNDRRFSLMRRMPPTATDDSARAVFPGVGAFMTARLYNEMLGVSLINSVGSHSFGVEPDGGAARPVGRMNFLHGVTPRTANSTHYFVALARDFALDSDPLSAVLMERNVSVVAEDIAILEAVEPGLDAHADLRREVSLASDAAAMQVRRRMEAIIAADDAAVVKVA